MTCCWAELSARADAASGRATTHLPIGLAGGHLNPAITLAFLLARKITAQRALCYWGAQVILTVDRLKLTVTQQHFCAPL